MVTYRCQEEVEKLELYRQGGYHPVEIGDQIHGRYTVLHKLGFGGFSTVWLAHDIQQKMLISLKILIADASQSSSEGQILRHLAQQPAGGRFAKTLCGSFWTNHHHTGNAFVLTVLDEFDILGPNGCHRCIVTAVLGPNVQEVNNGCLGYQLPLHISRRVAMQFARGLEYIHSCSVVHADLHTRNILFCIPGLESWTAADVYSYFGEPNKTPITRLDGNHPAPFAPRYTVRPLDFMKAQNTFLSNQCTIKIVDFGESFLLPAGQSVPKIVGTPLGYAAPEILFGDPLSPAIDVWAFACALYEILGGGTLFGLIFDSRNELLMDFVRTLGELPEQWRNKWEYGIGEEVFGGVSEIGMKEAVRLVRIGEDNEPAKDGDGFKPGELEMIERLLERVLRYEPTERLRAEEIVKLLPAAWERGEPG